MSEVWISCAIGDPSGASNGRCNGKSVAHDGCMWEERVTSGAVRFLPVAYVPPRVLRTMLLALDQVRGSERDEPTSALDRLAHVAAELTRHRGAPGESCLVPKGVVFDLVEDLGDAADDLAVRGLAAGSLVAAAIADQLIERITDARAELSP